MTAQTIYDAQDETGEFGGDVMHALLEVLYGDPSPSGHEPLTLAQLGQVAVEHAGTWVGEAAHAVLVYVSR